MMVAPTDFVGDGKEVHWISVLDHRLRRLASIQGLEIAFVLIPVAIFASFMTTAESATFMSAAIFGLLTFFGVDLLGRILDRADEAAAIGRSGGLGACLYLEVLDASFSFDGVVDAFALTRNLSLIATWPGIGAMYVRSMTIMLVDKQTLAEFRYLEHGTFYPILILSVIMFAQSLVQVPEVVTSLVRATMIGAALWSSILDRHRREAGA